MNPSKYAGQSIPVRSRGSRILILAPTILLALLYFYLAEASGLEESRVSLRYLLFAWAGLIAFILPYISFPDPGRSLSQLANLSPRSLLISYLRRHEVLLWTGSLLISATVISGLNSPDELAGAALLLLYGLALAAGIYLYAAGRYLKIGTQSQQWQEGERGRELSLKIAAIAKYPVDSGSVPSLIATVSISLLGMLTVVAGAVVSTYGGMVAEAATAGLLLLYGMASLYRLHERGDRWYYQTNAFFGEFFGTLKGPESFERVLKSDQLWWVPGRWKTHAWALMLQMDRKLPAGRIIAAGHLFIWVLAYRGAEGQLLVTFWILFALLHHGLLLLTANSELVPKWWLRLLDRPLHWMAARFWVQVRWLLPLLASMALLKWLFARYGWEEIVWTGLAYLAAAALTAILTGTVYERYGVKNNE